MVQLFVRTPNNDELAEVLRTLRADRGFTQAKVAEHIGVDRTDYTYMENGRVTINVFQVIRLAELYEMTVDQFLQAIKK